MDGKRRQYVAPSIGGTSSLKSAAAAAAEAATKRLVDLRRSAAALQTRQQQHQQQQQQQQVLQGTEVGASSSALSPSTLAYTGLSNDATRHAAHYTDSAPSSSTSPSSPLDGLRAAPHVSLSAPQSDASARARASAAAASALSASALSPQQRRDATRVAEAERERVGRGTFVLQRPDSFSSIAASAAAAAAAAAAAHARSRGVYATSPAHPPPAAAAPPASTFPSLPLHTSTDTRAEAHRPAAGLFPRPLSADPPTPVATQATISSSSALAASAAAAAAVAGGVPEIMEPPEPSTPPSEVKKRRSGKRKRDRTELAEEEPQRLRYEGLSPDQEQREGNEEEVEKGEEGRGEGTPSATERGAGGVRLGGPPPPAPLPQAEAEANTSARVLSTSHASPTGAPLTLLSFPAQPLSHTVVSMSALQSIIEKATAGAAATSGARSDPAATRVRKDPDDEESSTCLTSAGDEEARKQVTAAQESPSHSPTTLASTVRVGSEAEVQRVRAALQQREESVLERRACRAAALPLPPARLVLPLLGELPAAPRRAVYNREGCPCDPRSGFGDAFHDAVQRAMTRIVLQRDGRMHDVNAAKAASTRAAVTQAKAEGRAEELVRGVPPEVRDVVAYAQYTVRKQEQQQEEEKEESRGDLPSELAAEDVGASCANEASLASLHRYVESKLRAMSTAARIDGGGGDDSAAPPADAAVSPSTQSSARVAPSSLAVSHQHFVSTARATAAARQASAEAEMQAEQRLAAAAAAWRTSFSEMVAAQKPRRQQQQQHSERRRDGESWRIASVFSGVSEEAVQQLQQMFIAHSRRHQDGNWNALPAAQESAELRTLSKRQRKKAARQGLTLGIESLREQMELAGIELPPPPFTFNE